jgi:hypothetical protein
VVSNANSAHWLVALAPNRKKLERLYGRYNKRRYVATDPLRYVYRYERQRDREVAALVASSLAFGNVTQIQRSVERILHPMGNHPADYVLDASPKTLELDFRGFRHRWVSGDDMASLLTGVRNAMREYGSLKELFYAKLETDDPERLQEIKPVSQVDGAPRRGRSGRLERGAPFDAHRAAGRAYAPDIEISRPDEAPRGRSHDGAGDHRRIQAGRAGGSRQIRFCSHPPRDTARR